MADELGAVADVGEIYDTETGELQARNWEVRDLADLDWCLARLAAMEKQAEQNEQLASKAIARVEAWLAKQNERLSKGAAFFRSHAETYATQNRPELLGNGKAKSRALPNGKISWRKVGGRMRVVDGPTAIAFCEAEGLKAFVKHEPKLAVDELLHWLSGLTAIPPNTGCERTPVEEKLTVTATGTELTKRENDDE